MFKRRSVNNHISTIDRLNILRIRIRVRSICKQEIRCTHQCRNLIQSYIGCGSIQFLIECFCHTIHAYFCRIIIQHDIIHTFFSKNSSVCLRLNIIQQPECCFGITAAARNKCHTCLEHNIRIPGCHTLTVRSCQRCK